MEEATTPTPTTATSSSSQDLLSTTSCGQSSPSRPCQPYWVLTCDGVLTRVGFADFELLSHIHGEERDDARRRMLTCVFCHGSLVYLLERLNHNIVLIGSLPASCLPLWLQLLHAGCQDTLSVEKSQTTGSEEKEDPALASTAIPAALARARTLQLSLIERCALCAEMKKHLSRKVYDLVWKELSDRLTASQADINSVLGAEQLPAVMLNLLNMASSHKRHSKMDDWDVDEIYRRMITHDVVELECRDDARLFEIRRSVVETILEYWMANGLATDDSAVDDGDDGGVQTRNSSDGVYDVHGMFYEWKGILNDPDAPQVLRPRLSFAWCKRTKAVVQTITTYSDFLESEGSRKVFWTWSQQKADEFLG